MWYNEYIKRGRKTSKNQKGFNTMKNTTFSALVTIMNNTDVFNAIMTNCPDIDAQAVRAAINEELSGKMEKKKANQDAYAAAKAPVFAVLSTTPQTAQEIFTACEDELPDKFTKHKVQYALLNYWRNEIVVHDNDKPKTYSLSAD